MSSLLSGCRIRSTCEREGKGESRSESVSETPSEAGANETRGAAGDKRRKRGMHAVALLRDRERVRQEAKAQKRREEKVRDVHMH